MSYQFESERDETVRKYIENGCKGDLYLAHTKIDSLPEGLTVEGDLYLYNTPISKKYTVQQLKNMLPNVKGEIYV